MLLWLLLKVDFDSVFREHHLLPLTASSDHIESPFHLLEVNTAFLVLSLQHLPKFSCTAGADLEERVSKLHIQGTGLEYGIE